MVSFLTVSQQIDRSSAVWLRHQNRSVTPCCPACSRVASPGPGGPLPFPRRPGYGVASLQSRSCPLTPGSVPRSGDHAKLTAFCLESRHCGLQLSSGKIGGTRQVGARERSRCTAPAWDSVPTTAGHLMLTALGETSTGVQIAADS
ncbi:hypothetical protein NDU88_001911 [Pleurodeles waltl]|uniref:Uncharacterized protein n=1 Tax=Pleurodeles waltl TaxID=8319 RepID=A0AAV7LAV7_PLEWA|nr:hypothetical protein NDU88_001911 [Pleurodeles waltl]